MNATQPEVGPSLYVPGIRGVLRTRSAALAWLALGALGAVLAWRSWATWPDVQVDFGRELYAAWQLSAGAVLYRDIAWFNGPLSAYWNALLFRLFGAGLATLVWANLALLGLFVALLFGLLRRAAGDAGAFVGCAVGLLVFAFGQYARIHNYNFVTPYSHEITHGVLLSLGALACLSVHARGGRPRWLALAAALAGLVLLTKVEVALALCAALIAYTVWLQRDRRGDARWLGLIALAPLCAFALLAGPLGAEEALRGVAAPWLSLASPVSGLPLYREIAGLHAPGTALLIIAVVAAALAGLLGISVWVDRAVQRPVPRRVAAGLAFVAPLVLLWPLGSDLRLALRPLPFVLLGLLAALWWRRGSSDERAVGEDAALAALCVFALALLGKIVLGVQVAGYGFALAWPGAAFVVALAVGRLPSLVVRGGTESWSSTRACVLALVVLFCAAHLVDGQRWLDANRTAVGSGADAFVADERGAVAAQALAILEREFEPGATLVVLPEGVMLNYLARRRSSVPYINFMPPELLLFDESEMVRALDRSPPDAVVLWHKDTAEYGVPLFGRDYGRALYGWVEEHTERVEVVVEVPLQRPRSLGLEVRRLR